MHHLVRLSTMVICFFIVVSCALEEEKYDRDYTRSLRSMLDCTDDLAEYYQINGFYPPGELQEGLGDISYLPVENLANTSDSTHLDYYDPYSLEKTFMYYSSGDWYILISPGPDHKYENVFHIISYLYAKKSYDEPDSSNVKDAIRAVSYDPTNGNVSSGDIICSSNNIGYRPYEMKNMIELRKMSSEVL